MQILKYSMYIILYLWPLINRGTYCRVYAINSKLHEIINNFKKLFSESLNNIKTGENDLTIIICECLLVYIEESVTLEMLSCIMEKFDNIYFLEYDLIGPDNPFGKEMIDN